MARKLGKRTDQRMAMLRNQVSELLWYGEIETTVDRAKEVRRMAEKLITLAIRTYQDEVTVTKTKTGAKARRRKSSLSTTAQRNLPHAEDLWRNCAICRKCARKRRANPLTSRASRT